MLGHRDGHLCGRTAAEFLQHRQQTGDGQRFQQAGSRAVLFQRLGVNLGVTRQRQHQMVGHAERGTQLIAVNAEVAHRNRYGNQQNVVELGGQRGNTYRIDDLERRCRQHIQRRLRGGGIGLHVGDTLALQAAGIRPFRNDVRIEIEVDIEPER